VELSKDRRLQVTTGQKVEWCLRRGPFISAPFFPQDFG
jgi:hypothetical protein